MLITYVAVVCNPDNWVGCVVRIPMLQNVLSNGAWHTER